VSAGFLPPGPARRVRSGRRSHWSVVAVIALVLMLTTDATFAQGESPTTDPPADEPTASEWGRVPFEAGLRDPDGASWIESIAAGPRGIVAVGRAPIGAAAWFSVDGLTWQRAVPPRSWTTRGQHGWFPTLRDVVATDDGFVVVGIEHDGPISTTGSVWTSPDGLIWRRSARGVGPYLTDVIEHQGDLYAVSGGVHKQTTPAIWRSDDGRKWQRVYTSPEGSGIEVIASDDDVIVAGDGFTMLVSEDGQTWEPASIDPIRRGGDDDLYDATAFDGGFVAVGQRGRNAAVWLSKDGSSWETAPETIPTRGYITHFHAVAPIPDGGLVAAANNDLYDAFIYQSADGQTWERVLEQIGLDFDYADFALAGAASTDEGALIAGFDRDASRGVSAAVWTSPAPPIAARDGLASTACPGSRPTLSELLEMDPASRVECFGDRSLSFRALLKGPEPGDLDMGQGPPFWLAMGVGGARAVAVDAEPPVAMSLVLNRRPKDRDRIRLPRDRWVSVTGHFDDPSARRCPRSERETCRQRFVVTDVRGVK
jgi:hypothetical protein